MLSQYAQLPGGLANRLPLPVTTSAPVADEADETGLIAAARRGDAAAYGSLVHKYQDRLCSALRRICGSMTDAQDAAQEAYLRAYTNLGQYTGASAFYSWLYRIAVNAVVSEHRRNKARLNREQSRSLRDPSRGRNLPPPDEPLLRDERAAQVRAALDSLSAEHRTILVLREIEDCEYHEIAAVLAIPKGTVRSRLHRARLALRQQLETTSELQEPLTR